MKPKNGKKRSKKSDSDESSSEEEEEDLLHDLDGEESLHFSSSSEEAELESDGEEYQPAGRNAKRALKMRKSQFSS